ncbi:MAG TPA: ATP-binding protein [Anaeromyxobacteraceae bacterium]|nr:ATP-binding protein [Anaeromyxobacteraceae bacterium]
MGQLRKIWSRLARSMRARILLPTSLLFIATLAIMVYAAVRAYGHDIEKVQRERAELFAHYVGGGVTEAMLQGRPGQVPELLGFMRTHRADLDSISLLRHDGQVVYSTDRALVGTMPWKSIMEFERSRVVPIAGDEYAVVQPVLNAETCTNCHGREAKINGWLDLRFTRAPAVAAESELARTLGISAGGAFVFLIAIAWWLVGREAVSPLQRLVASMRRAESGDLTVRADEGRPDELGVAARGFDATLAALRRSQAELEAFYRERMVRADRFAAVGEMATGLAHEIKNPLAGLSGALELLAEDLSENPRQAEVVGEMRHQVSRLTHTMESLLSFARPPKAKLRSTDVNATLEKVLFLIRQQRRNAPLDVEAELDAGVPAVLADPSQLEQVFLNICLNACQAMDGKGGKLVVRSRLSEGRVSVEVEDTGPGIPETVRPNLFKPFFTTKREGNGLGLAISARIVAEHGGHIGYRCPSTGGTIFTVALQPVRAGAERPQPEHAA